MVPSTYKHDVINLPWAETSHKKTLSCGPNHIKTLHFKPPLSEYLLYSCKETLSYGPIHIQTLCFKSPLGRHLSQVNTQSWSQPQINTVFYLNLPETGTSLLEVPDTFPASRESACERFN